jgi:TnpA family transposase
VIPDGDLGENTGQVNIRYGSLPGVTLYPQISERYAPFHAKPINTRMVLTQCEV